MPSMATDLPIEALESLRQSQNHVSPLFSSLLIEVDPLSEYIPWNVAAGPSASSVVSRNLLPDM
jgi:hypothetical protein